MTANRSVHRPLRDPVQIPGGLGPSSPSAQVLTDTDGDSADVETMFTGKRALTVNDPMQSLVLTVLSEMRDELAAIRSLLERQ